MINSNMFESRTKSPIVEEIGYPWPYSGSARLYRLCIKLYFLQCIKIYQQFRLQFPEFMFNCHAYFETPNENINFKAQFSITSFSVLFRAIVFYCLLSYWVNDNLPIPPYFALECYWPKLLMKLPLFVDFFYSSYPNS